MRNNLETNSITLEQKSMAISDALRYDFNLDPEFNKSSLKIIEDLIKNTPAEEHLKMLFPKGEHPARKKELLCLAADCGSLFLFDFVNDLVTKANWEETKMTTEINLSTVVLKAAQGGHPEIINRVAEMVKDPKALKRIRNHCKSDLQENEAGIIKSISDKENEAEMIKLISDNLRIEPATLEEKSMDISDALRDYDFNFDPEFNQLYLKIIEDLIKSTPAEEHLKMFFPKGGHTARKKELLCLAADCGSLFLFDFVNDLVTKANWEETKKETEINLSTVVVKAAQGGHSDIINRVAEMVPDPKALKRIRDRCKSDLKENEAEMIKLISDNLRIEPATLEQKSMAISDALSYDFNLDPEFNQSSLEIIEDLIRSTPAEEHLKMFFPKGGHPARKKKLLCLAADCGSLSLFNFVNDLTKADWEEPERTERNLSTVVLKAAQGEHPEIINRVVEMVPDLKARERIRDYCKPYLENDEAGMIKLISDNLGIQTPSLKQKSMSTSEALRAYNRETIERTLASAHVKKDAALRTPAPVVKTNEAKTLDDPKVKQKT